MPFDGRNYETEVKHPSLEGLIAWLEAQDPETEYDYNDNHNCLLCRYFRAAGIEVGWMGGVEWWDSAGQKHELPPALIDIPVSAPRDYSGALSRARAVLKTAGQ